MKNAIVVVFSDTHINSTVGLCPPSVKLDDAGVYKSSKAQRWLWSNWLDFWKDVAAEKKRLGYPVVSVANGDIADDNAHSNTQLITSNLADIIKLAHAALQPCLSVTDHFFATRGTEAHVGASASMDELVAESMGAHGDGNTSSWWWLRGKFGGVTFDMAHHPGTGSASPHLRHGPAGRVAARIIHDYADMRELPPQIGIRSHNHTFSDSGESYACRVFITMPWQLTTAFGHRVGYSGRLSPIGGLIFICENGEYSCKIRQYRAKPQRYFTL
jgi:hypothetical protein